MIQLHENGSVRLAGLQPEMDVAKDAVEKVFAKYSLPAVITAGTEEFKSNGLLIHSVSSLHPRGYALDFRSKHIPNGVYTKLISDIRDTLKVISAAYQVVVHKSHIHIEYDLKIAWRLHHG